MTAPHSPTPTATNTAPTRPSADPATDGQRTPNTPSTSHLPPRTEWLSEDLLAGQSSVDLLHKGMRYTLRQTRQGKLILTK